LGDGVNSTATLSPRHARRAALALLLAALAVLPRPRALGQGNLGFLRDTPFAHFRGDDSKLMRQAAMTVLKDAKPGSTQSWQNPATGNSGTVTLDQMFTGTSGRPCGLLTIASRTRQVSGSSQMTVCQRQDGQWALATEQPPS